MSDPDAILTAAEEVSAILKQRGVETVVIGAVALTSTMRREFEQVAGNGLFARQGIETGLEPAANGRAKHQKSP